jgi:vacuolar-type H+-ATPase catalytic subunit A/Vma1
VKASDLDDRVVLRAVELSCVLRDSWTNTAAVAEAFPGSPFKVVAVKLSKLLRRKLLTGCDCGCRGNWELTEVGREFAGIDTAWRKNPCE